MKKVDSPVQLPVNQDSLKMQVAEHCFWMELVICFYNAG